MHKKPLICKGNWYKNPVIYDFFSRAEDPDNVCFDIVTENLKHQIVNPIDLATGTGRMLGLLGHLPFAGKLYGVDKTKTMCDFAKNYYKAEIINGTIEDIGSMGIESSLIISCFGFPSKVWNKERAKKEYEAVKSILNGVFITIGWNEKFDCELSKMWYNFVPDDIKAVNFKEWQQKKRELITTPRNCGLTWLKQDVETVLRFSSLQESAFVMGHLFGEYAMKYVIENNKIEWQMKLGITLDVCRK